MGFSRHVQCQNCPHEFDVHIGGGNSFERLRCETCGRSITVKKSNVSLSERPTVEETMLAYEAVTGTCKCGGTFKWNARPRCPECRSTDLRDIPDFTVNFC